MATTKSTVVGIRLDNDRRAWVEGEAARLGVSVRGLFEGMIDAARTGETVEAARDIAGLGSAVPMPSSRGEATSAGGDPSSVNSPSSAPPDGAAGSSTWPRFGPITALPGGLIRGAFMLTADLIESSAQCASKRLGTCAFTRRWIERSG